MNPAHSQNGRSGIVSPKRAKGSALVLVAALVGVFLWMSKRQTVHLPGGSDISLVAVTQGATNIFFPGGLRDELVYRWVPAKGLRIFGVGIRPLPPLRADGFYRNGEPAEPNKAVFWVRHTGGTNALDFPSGRENWFSDIRAQLVGEQGETWEMRPGYAWFFPDNRKGRLGISAWRFPAFPRRCRTLKFRILNRNATNGWQVLAEFKTRNPAPGAYAVWKASSLPVTQQRGDLEVTLVELVSGLKPVHYLQQDRRPFTLATFRLKEQGQLTEAWLPDRLEAIDATGNEGSFQIVDYGTTNGLVFFDAQATSLNPSELWRLRTRFTHLKHLPAARLWISPPLPVRERASSPETVTSWFQMYQVKMEYEHGTLEVKLSPAPADSQLRLVDIVDDQGRPVQRLGDSEDEDGFASRLRIAQDVESIRVTISLCETLTFDFLAQPTQL